MGNLGERAEAIIAAGHRCELKQEGYYWARLIVRDPPKHLPQKRDFPMLCSPSVVRLGFSTQGTPHISSPDVLRRTVLEDWVFLERISEPSVSSAEVKDG
jgi:hypothetical protein